MTARLSKLSFSPFKSSVSFILFLMISLSTHAQLSIDAGKDTTYCSEQDFNSQILGTTVTIVNGKPPFKFAWECDYRITDKLVFSARFLLNDTTLQTPTFKNIPVDQDWLKFTLTVTDSENNVAKDSLSVRFSSFAYLTGGEQPRFYIEKGDSILLTFPNSGIGGGIEPLTYYLRPKTYLSDPNSLVTWCKPDSSVQYEEFAIDSCGCLSESVLAYDIRILPETNDNNPEFAPIGAKWYFNYPNSTSNDYVLYESKKDSTIQGKDSRVINVWLNNSKLVSREYIHQNGDSIFYYNENYNSFFLLYNFSAKAGDTITVHPAKFKPTKAFFSYDDSISDFKYKILLADSVQLSGQWIKRQKVTLLQDGLWGFSKPDGKDYYIINKIGSLAYFFGVQSGITPEDKFSICRCYSDSDFEFKSPHWGSNCDLTLDALTYDFQTVYSNRVTLFENSEKQIKALRIDSVKTDIDSVFYPFATIQEVSENCFSPYKASWIGEKVVVKPDGTNLFFNRDGDTITLKTRARLNETWIAFQRADNFRVKATMQSVGMENFLGLTDSVKTITLTVTDQNENTLEHPLNNLKLRISKNYGFVETLNFYLFPDIEILGTTERLENLFLAGLTNPEVGVQNLTWFEVNDFQPGDELHILKDISSWDEWNGNKIGFSIITKSILKYLKRYDYMDSIVYLVSENQSIQTIETHTDTITYNCDTTILVIKPDPQFDKLPGEPIIDEWKEVTNYLMENTDVLSKLYPGVYESIHHVKDSCWAMAVVDGCFKYETYFKGFGGPYYTCSNCCSSGGEKRKLVYYKKGETEWGEKLVITDVPEPNDNNPEFAPIGAEWHYSQFVGFDPPQGANYVKHTCFKDSTIDGKLVKVIQKTKFTREGQFELGFEYLHQNGDTISYWKNGEFHELYNFSLEEGDSMLIYSDTSNYMSCDTSHYGWINIDSVFSVTINNQKLKGYFASHKEGSYWGFDGFPIIEKIGSTLYLLPGDVGCVVDAIGIGPLRCYSDPEFGIYHNGKEPCDTLTTFPIYAPVINSNHQFNFFPNPAASFVTISNPSNIPIKKIELTDFSGRVVQTWKMQEVVENTLNIQHIPPGIYLLKAVTEKGIKTGKLVVQ